jgi:hypothetical protein
LIRAEGPCPALEPPGHITDVRTKTAKNGKNRRKLANPPDMALLLQTANHLLALTGRCNFELDYRKPCMHASISKEKNLIRKG